MMEHKNYSLGDQVYEELESDILAGKYAHGEITTEMKLCSELGVSRTPVREALSRLLSAHLIEETGKGIQILGITPEDLSDFMEIRCRLDGPAAAKCAARITDEELASLKETLDLQEFYLSKADSDRIKTMDSRFHETIYRASGSAAFYDVLAPLHNKVQRFRRAALEKSARAERSFAEHRAIYEALAAHDAEKASEMMTLHACNARDNLLNAAKKAGF